jgi:hypothetical protein
LEGLHNQGFSICERFNKKGYREVLDTSTKQAATVYLGSFLDYDWSDGDVVFANSTCFDDDLMNAMQQQAETLKPGAILVTFTKGLTNFSKFELLEKKRHKMSWGPATVYIHRRLGKDGKPHTEPFKLHLLPMDHEEYRTPEGSDEESDESEEEEEEDEVSPPGMTRAQLYAAAGVKIPTDEDSEEDESESESSDDEYPTYLDDLEDDSDASDDLEVPDETRVTSDEAQAIIDRYMSTMTMRDLPSTSTSTSTTTSTSTSTSGNYRERKPPTMSIVPPEDTTNYNYQGHAVGGLEGFTSPERFGPSANPGFSSPQDSGLLARKALAKKRAAAQRQ